MGGTHQCLKIRWKSQIIRERSEVPAQFVKSVTGSKLQQRDGYNRAPGNCILGARILTRPIIAGSMGAGMWYPNKKQWRVIWISFAGASFFFFLAVAGPREVSSEACYALSIIILAFGCLMVLYHGRTN